MARSGEIGPTIVTVTGTLNRREAFTVGAVTSIVVSVAVVDVVDVAGVVDVSGAVAGAAEP